MVSTVVRGGHKDTSESERSCKGIFSLSILSLPSCGKEPVLPPEVTNVVNTGRQLSSTVQNSKIERYCRSALCRKSHRVAFSVAR
jgi:hypothetical protein